MCKCACGSEKYVNIYNLCTGKSISCGCLSNHREFAKTHGLSSVPEYQAWKSIKARCYNVNHKDYPLYGGRGIIVCASWINSFPRFYHDMGKKPSPKHSIDRVDFNGHYEPSNCRWATQKEQTNNTRRSIRVTFNGVLMTVSQLSEQTGIKESTIYHRISAGWPCDKISQIKA